MKQYWKDNPDEVGWEPPPLPKVCRPWKPWEEEVIRSWLAEGFKVYEIAHHLNRSEGAVKKRAERLHVSYKVPVNRLYRFKRRIYNSRGECNDEKINMRFTRESDERPYYWEKRRGRKCRNLNFAGEFDLA
jgi:hypothetical protein